MTVPNPPADSGPVAIICGGGSFPFTVADALMKSGRGAVLFALRGFADPDRVTGYPHHWAHVTQLGRFLRLARREGCRDVIFIGTLVRPSFRQLVNFDLATLRVLPGAIRHFYGGDNHLLTGMARMLEDHGFRLLGAHEVAPEILVPEGALGQVAPAPRDLDDIHYGLEVLRAIGPFDVGQGVVVANRHVIAVEAAEGTDQMLTRVGELRQSKRFRAPPGIGVLVKAPKSGQDWRFDLPSIGPRTIEGIIEAGLAGLAVKAGGSIIAEPQIVVEKADRAGVFVAGFPETPGGSA
ncbi:MAG: LpxI family protein [Pseudorhodoplanes sp.]|uniref:LpxI family protein n=1 Tax=Pseudorhodoplanes sp. TaxID=1934341 RepID=UPI003D09AE1D